MLFRKNKLTIDQSDGNTFSWTDLGSDVYQVGNMSWLPYIAPLTLSYKGTVMIEVPAGSTLNSGEWLWDSVNGLQVKLSDDSDPTNAPDGDFKISTPVVIVNGADFTANGGIQIGMRISNNSDTDMDIVLITTDSNGVASDCTLLTISKAESFKDFEIKNFIDQEDVLMIMTSNENCSIKLTGDK